MAKITFTAELITAFREREKRQALDTIIGEVASATLASNKKGTVCLELVLVGKATGITFEGKSVEISGSCRIYNISLTKTILTVGSSTKNDDSTLIVAADGSVTVKAATVQDTPTANANVLNL